MKTIYYAYIKKLEVPDTAADQDIDAFIFSQIVKENGENLADYVWSEKPNLFADE